MERKKTTSYARSVEALFLRMERRLKRPLKFTHKRSIEAIIFLIIFV